MPKEGRQAANLLWRNRQPFFLGFVVREVDRAPTTRTGEVMETLLQPPVWGALRASWQEAGKGKRSAFVGAVIAL